GQSKYLLSEACEYKNNFLVFNPNLAVITNIESEHLDYFKNLAGIKKSFRKFVGQIRKGGWLVVNGDNKNASELKKYYSGQTLTFGIKNKADFQATEVQIGRDGLTQFKLKTGKKFGNYNNKIFELSVPGEFNIYNALGAIASAAVLGVGPEVTVKALAQFDGVWRRFEFKGKTKSGIEIYDDYGHHPTEIRATLAAAKEKFKARKIWVVFQPHLYSRTKDFMSEFAAALNLADNIIVVDIYAAREINKYKISSRDVVDLINKKYWREKPAVYIPTFDKAVEYLKKNLKKGEVVMTMGAGEAYKVGEELLG
ncbi:MAG TPA: Mur ligase family protein, partial [Patescibacteria group bacterium]|nr:Mur ligase family protein [Patescibacteria group bacterium]